MNAIIANPISWGDQIRLKRLELASINRDLAEARVQRVRNSALKWCIRGFCLPFSIAGAALRICPFIASNSYNCCCTHCCSCLERRGDYDFLSCDDAGRHHKGGCRSDCTLCVFCHNNDSYHCVDALCGLPPETKKPYTICTEENLFSYGCPECLPACCWEVSNKEKRLLQKLETIRILIERLPQELERFTGLPNVLVDLTCQFVGDYGPPIQQMKVPDDFVPSKDPYAYSNDYSCYPTVCPNGCRDALYK